MRNSIKKNVDRYDPKKAEQLKKKHREFAEQRKSFECAWGEFSAKTLINAGKLEVLTRENAKILQKIVEARQINVKARN